MTEQKKRSREKRPTPKETQARFNLLHAAEATPEGRKLEEEYQTASRQATSVFLQETRETREIWDTVCRQAHFRQDKTVRGAEGVRQAGMNKIVNELEQEPRYAVWKEKHE